MIFGIYCRKSVLTDKGESVENQQEICRNYILSRFGEGHTIDIYEDEGYSGKNTARPMFLRLTEDIKGRGLDYVVCYRLDRVSRSVSDFSAFVEMLNRYSTGLICVREEFDTSRPVGKAMMYMASVFSQLERETIGERVRDNMLMLARSGRWLGGRPPLGYDSVRLPYTDAGGRIKTAAYLTENAALEEVKRIYGWLFETGSCKGAAEKAALMGAATARGGDFTPAAVRDVVTNPVYCQADKDAFVYFEKQGTAVYGEPCRRGLLAYNKDAEDMVVAVGTHAPAVSGLDWIRAQRLASGGHSLDMRSVEMGGALASGAIVCNGCGGRMYAVKRSGGRGFDYICKNKRLHKSCNMKNLPGAAADGDIMEHIVLTGDLRRDKMAVRAGLYILWDGKELKIEAVDDGKKDKNEP